MAASASDAGAGRPSDPLMSWAAAATDPQAPEADHAYRPEAWVGKKIGFLTGTLFDEVVAKDIPGSVPVHFNSRHDAYEALHRGRLDAVLDTYISASKFTHSMGGLRILGPPVIMIDCGVVFSKEAAPLREQFNEFLRVIRADGTHADMLARWVGRPDSPPMPDLPPGGKNGVIRLATALDTDGVSFLQNRRPAGFDVEILLRFAQYVDRKPEWFFIEFGGLIPAVDSGKVDCAADIIMNTPARRERVDFSDVYFLSSGVLVVGDGAHGDGHAALGFWDELRDMARRNLVQEDRWKNLLEGLGVTCLISLLGFAVAMAVGFGVCGLHVSSRPWLRRAGALYAGLMRGTPIVVFLMVMFYVVFTGKQWHPVEVAVIAFGLYFGSTLGRIFQTALDTVPRGQAEAARAMGFGRIRTFFVITFPQAARFALPLCYGEFVAMFHETAVVGYIAIIDLTKAGDIIRSRTYDAFFPLVTVALIYLVVTAALVALFQRLGRQYRGGHAA